MRALLPSSPKNATCIYLLCLLHCDDVLIGPPKISTEARVAKNARRAKGYGFVTCATQEDVDKAVAALHHTELEGRQLNVEAAREREPRPEGEEAPKRTRKPRQRNSRRRQVGEEETEGDAAAADGEESPKTVAFY